MYIVSSSIADDQIPTVTDGVLNFITGFGGKVIKEEQMGKKKLAYPIKKTKNGFYSAVTFELDGTKVSDLDTKVRTTEGIIRHLIVSLDEAIQRMAKDAVAQEKMNRSRTMNAHTMGAGVAAGSPVGATVSTAPVSTITSENIDEKIEEALSEDLGKI